MQEGVSLNLSRIKDFGCFLLQCDMNSGLDNSNPTHIYRRTHHEQVKMMLISRLRLIGLQCHVAVKRYQGPHSVLEANLHFPFQMMG